MNLRSILPSLVASAILASTLMALPSTAFAAGPVAESQVHIRNAVAAYRDGDAPGYVRELESALSLNPASLSTRYNLACGYALTGQEDKALDLLQGLVAERVDFGLADDPDLDALRDSAGFQELLHRNAENVQPVIASEPFLTFAQHGLVPEGIARDPESGRLFFGSMRTGEVYAVDQKGYVSRFSSVDRQNRLSAVGMTVDSASGLLWVVGSVFELAENTGADPAATSGVFGIDLVTGAVKDTFLTPGPDDWLNDVVVTDDGRLFATGNRLFSANRREGRLEAIETGVEAFGLNGIALAPDQQTLIVASYPVGLLAINSATGDAWMLEPPQNTTFYGIDGLYWHSGSLIAIQNGARPWRLIRIHLDDRLMRATMVEILEMGNEATTPMTGAIDGDSIYYVGESGGPATVPTQFPEAMQDSLGAVTIRRAPIGSP